jgi:hypothetical protein
MSRCVIGFDFAAKHGALVVVSEVAGRASIRQAFTWDAWQVENVDQSREVMAGFETAVTERRPQLVAYEKIRPRKRFKFDVVRVQRAQAGYLLAHCHALGVEALEVPQQGPEAGWAAASWLTQWPSAEVPEELYALLGSREGSEAVNLRDACAIAVAGLNELRDRERPVDGKELA